MLLPADLMMSLNNAAWQRSDSHSAPVSPVAAIAAGRLLSAGDSFAGNAQYSAGSDAESDPRVLINKLLARMTGEQSEGFAADFVAHLTEQLPVSEPPVEEMPGLALTPAVDLQADPDVESAGAVSWSVDELLKFARQLTEDGRTLPATEQNLPQVLASAVAALHSRQLVELPLAEGASLVSEVSEVLTAMLQQGDVPAPPADFSPVLSSPGVVQLDPTAALSGQLVSNEAPHEALTAVVQAGPAAAAPAMPERPAAALPGQRIASGHVEPARASAADASSATQSAATGAGAQGASERTVNNPAVANAPALNWLSTELQLAVSGQTTGPAPTEQLTETSRLSVQSTAAPTASELAGELYGADQRRELAQQARAASLAAQQPAVQSRNELLQAQTLSFGNVGWGEGVGRQLLLMTANGINSAQIRLDPPELGAMTIRIELIDKAATVNFVSQHAMVRDALEAQLPRLHDLLRGEGIDLRQASVSDQSAQQGGSDAQGQPRDSRGRSAGGESAELGADVSAVRKSEHLIDYYA
jgi:flagellar hook-length control protein FliK